jgi:hypothetical protein
VFTFDTGYLFAVASGQAPVKFGSLGETEVDLDMSVVQNPTNLQFGSVPTIKGGALKLTAKPANINGLMVCQLFFGQAPSAGSQGVSRDQVVTVPATPYQVTPTVPNSGTWLQDLGVQYSSSGIVLVPVSSNPSQGQYSVSAGVYTFNSADTGQALVVNYLYSQAAGVSLALTNPWQGLAPTWQAVLQGQYNGAQIVWNLPRCASTSFKMLMPLEKIVIPEFRFQAFGDASSGGVQGSLGTFSFAN